MEVATPLNAQALFISEVAEWLRIFIDPGQVTELRAIRVGDRNGRQTGTEAGFYDFEHLENMAKAGLEISQKASGVYFIPNPLHKDLLARRSNKLGSAKEGELATDALVIKRKWFLVDADPVRLDGISSTDAEKKFAWVAIHEAQQCLEERGFSEMVLADSGNGYHILVAIPEIHASDGKFVQCTLKELAAAIDTPHVKIDTKVFNPARIVKLYGTTSRKGDSTTDRPHRPSRVLEIFK